MSCECEIILKEIKKEFPNANFNIDEACEAWNERSKKLKNNNIKIDPDDDHIHACTCPTCGVTICGRCV